MSDIEEAELNSRKSESKKSESKKSDSKRSGNKRKKAEKKGISIRTFLVTTLIVLVVLVLVFIYYGITGIYRSRATGALLGETHDRTTQVAETIESVMETAADTDGFDAAVMSDAVKSVLSSSAYIISGDILVIDEHYRIISDTDDERVDSYIISEDVMNIMKSETEVISRVSGGYAEVMQPVKVGDAVKGVILTRASSQSVTDSILYMQKRILMVLVVALIVSVIAIVLISVKAVDRLNQINEELYHTSQGSLREKLGVEGFRETRYLAQNYNSVLEKLTTIDQTRQEFVSNVSHELKTPITSMKILAESLVQNEAATTEEYKDFMSDIVDEIDRETQIINDLLTLVKTDRGESSLNYERVDVNALLDAIVKTVSPLAKQRGIQISYEKFKVVEADVDSSKLSMAVSNIIENAVKYNVDNGWIKVSLNTDNRFFYIKVSDSGVGIPDDVKDKVFERFYRVDKARSRDTGGTGLGLSITRSIVNAHGGTIRLYSESGKGTTFTIRIPINHSTESDQQEDNAVRSESSEMSSAGADSKQTAKRSRKADKRRAETLLLVLCMTGLTLSATACTIATEEPATTEETISIVSTAGTVQLYHAEGVEVVADDDRYQLRQPDQLSASVEEVMNQLSLADGMTFNSYSIDEDGNVRVMMLLTGDVSEEDILMSKAVIVRSLSGLMNIGSVAIQISTESGEDVDLATYTDGSFYYYDKEK